MVKQVVATLGTIWQVTLQPPAKNYFQGTLISG